MHRFCILLSALVWAGADALTAATCARGLRSRAAAPAMLLEQRSGKADARARQMPKGLPPAIADRVSFATSGIKQANQVEMVEILWKEFKKCYATEALALEAVTKNAAVLQPQLNSPTKIKGTYGHC